MRAVKKLPTILPWIFAVAGCGGPPVGVVRDGGRVIDDLGVADVVADVPDVAVVDVVIGDAGTPDIVTVIATDAADTMTPDVGALDVSDASALDVPDASIDVPTVVDSMTPDIVTVDVPDVICTGPAFGTCRGGCVSLSTTTDCGACDRACSSAQTCVAGACMALTCPSGMRLIPAGQFLMGDTSGLRPFRPLHGVRLTAYCMDETEVTTSAYATCLTTGMCLPGDTTRGCNWSVAGREQHPINCVDWTQARAYCQWRGGDLATEARWEYAARGMEGLTFPWGHDPPTTQLCWNGLTPIRAETCAVRLFPVGDSPFGMSDMAGNVWEWTLDPAGDYSGDATSYVTDPVGTPAGTERVRRGGSWYTENPINVRATDRSFVGTGYRASDTGFRCARQPTTCALGSGDCDGSASNGCEVNTQTSSAHCGACGRACPSGRTCVAGACSLGS